MNSWHDFLMIIINVIWELIRSKIFIVFPDIQVKKYVGLGCGLASLITENLLIHPFVVLRRQCQVNPSSNKYHLVPLTLVPVIIRLYHTQGLNTLWKGIGSVLIVRGLTLAVEDLLSKVTPWPKYVSQKNLKI